MTTTPLHARRPVPSGWATRPGDSDGWVQRAREVATDLAVDLAKQGVPFRDAYRQAADPARWNEGDPVASLAARTSPGASGRPMFEVLRTRLAALG